MADGLEDDRETGGDDAAEAALQRTRAEARRRFELFLAQVQAGLPADAEPDFAGADEDVAEELRRSVADYRLLRRDYQEAAGALAAGRRLGKFLLVRETGRGGMGIVWEVEQVLPRRRVALKILHPQLSRDEDWVRRFEREALAASSVEHDHIVKVHEVGVHDGLHWIAMEFVPGGLTLADHVADLRRVGAAPPDHARRMARIFADLASALHAAHESGVVHRDVKPGNILLTPEGQPKLADFGLAALEGPLSVTPGIERAGSPYYMSPEQARGGRERVDARSDIYSLGVALYEALTFERPYAGQDEHELLRRIVEGDVPDPRRSRPGIARDLAHIVQRMAANRRDARYASAADAAADLERFLGGERVHAGAPSMLWRAWKFARRHPAWSSSAAVAAGMLLLFIVLSVRASSEEARASAAAELVQAVIRLDDPAAPAGGPDALADLAARLRAAATQDAEVDGLRAARLHLAAARCERLGGRLKAAASELREALVQLPPGDDELRLQIMDALAGTLGELDDFAGLQSLLPTALELSKRIDKPDSASAGPHRRTWRLLCALWTGHLRREDRMAAAALEAAHPELTHGDLLAELRARHAKFQQEQPGFDERNLEAGLQLLRALVHLEHYSEGWELAKAIESPLRADDPRRDQAAMECALLQAVCSNRLRREGGRSQVGRTSRLSQLADARFGREHPIALLARLRWCIACMDDAGSGAAPGGWPLVRDSYATLVADMVRVLGPLHLDTLKARTGLLLAEMRVHFVQPDEARMRSLVGEADELVASMRQVYGVYHSRTVIAERARLGLLDILGDRRSALEVRRRFVDHIVAADGALAPDAFDLQAELVDELLWSGEHAEARRRAAEFRRALRRLDAAEAPRGELELRGMMLQAAAALMDGDHEAARSALAGWELQAPLAERRMNDQGRGAQRREIAFLRRVFDACLDRDGQAAAALAAESAQRWVGGSGDDPLALLLLARCGRLLHDPRLDGVLGELRANSIASRDALAARWKQIDALLPAGTGADRTGAR